LRAIAEREAISVDDEAVDAAVGRIARVALEAQQPKQAEAFVHSPQLRTALQNDLFERQLTDRLIELATEGRGAVVNGWEPPAAAAEEAPEGAAEPATSDAQERADGGETTDEQESAGA
jgi:trigger factor